jgi:hypothetical protein
MYLLLEARRLVSYLGWSYYRPLQYHGLSHAGKEKGKGELKQPDALG